jgi:membrane protein DedA with SNARE-associated domain
LLRFIRQNPLLGLLLALSMEAWLGLPGEAMIAVAASTVAQAYGLLRIAVGGVVGMLLNDLILFTLSQAGRDVLTHWLGTHGLHWHLSSEMVLGAKFLPPLRSAAYVLYGMQGATFWHFVAISLLSSIAWVSLYLLLGSSFRERIGGFMHWAEGGGRWMTMAEVALTLSVVAIAWL